jgi:hypothetical protein
LIYQYADRDRDPGERHDVARDADLTHEQESAEHGERQRDPDDERRAEVHHHEQDHERREDDFLDERAPHRVQGFLDEPLPLVERHDPDSFR